jgi:dTDP-4-dehydrorhamnose 3,5-epimerase
MPFHNGATMQIIETAIPDIKILEPKVFGDDRGFFLESYNQRLLAEKVGIHDQFVQDNHSHSVQGVLRGLHYQLKMPQGKLVRVVFGEAFDVAVDMRRSSPTFGKWVSVHLSAQNKRMLWVPPGFAHGFLVVSPEADFLYKTTNFYDPSSEHCILWNDPDLAIPWPIKGFSPSLSAKDQQGKRFKEAIAFS